MGGQEGPAALRLVGEGGIVQALHAARGLHAGVWITGNIQIIFYVSRTLFFKSWTFSEFNQQV